MKRGSRLYEGKSKIVYEADRDGLAIVEFKDDATAFDGKKKGTIRGKGECNARITARIFELLEREGVATHYEETLDRCSLLVKRLDMIKIEVVPRNVVAGSLAKRLGLEEGSPLERPVVELYYKRDDLGDPMINRHHVAALELASPSEVDLMEETALKVNEIVGGFLRDRGIVLVDFKLEFGRCGDELILGDEITPDSCRLWDARTGHRLDKDRFRRDLGGVEDAYREVLGRIEGA